MHILKRSLLTLAVLIVTATVLVFAKSIALNFGIVLGAIPTLLVMLPGIFLIKKIWSRSTRRKTRTELLIALRQMIDDPATPPERKQEAVDKLAQLERAK